MKILTLFLSWAFAFLFLGRIIEMSMLFDWIDIPWALVFLVGLLISAGIYSAVTDTE